MRKEKGFRRESEGEERKKETGTENRRIRDFLGKEERVKMKELCNVL